MNDFVRDVIGTGKDLLDAWGDAQTAALTTHLAYGTPGPKTLVISIAPQGLSVPVGHLVVTHIGPDGQPTTTVRTTAPESGNLYPVSVGNAVPEPGPVLGSVGVTFVPGGGTPPLPPAVGGLRRIVTPLNRGFSALKGGVVIDLSWGESPVEREEIQNPDDGSVTVVHRYTNGGSVRATYTHDESGRLVLQESQVISTDPATGISEATTYVHDASGEARAALVETGGHAYVPGMEPTSANELSLMDQLAEMNNAKSQIATEDAEQQIQENRRAQILAQKEARMEAAAGGGTRDAGIGGGSDRDDDLVTGAPRVTTQDGDTVTYAYGDGTTVTFNKNPGGVWGTPTDDYMNPLSDDRDVEDVGPPIVLDLDGDGVEISPLVGAERQFQLAA